MPSPYASNDLFFARALASLSATLLEAMHAAELTDPGVLRLYPRYTSEELGIDEEVHVVTSKSRRVSPNISPTMSSGTILAVVAKRGTSDLVGSGRRWSRWDWAAAQSEHSCCRHGDVAEETTVVDNSVDPSSIAHAEAVPSWSVWTWSWAHYLHRWLTASPLRGFLRLATATFATSSDVRVKEEIPGETFFCLYSFVQKNIHTDKTAQQP